MESQPTSTANQVQPPVTTLQLQQALNPIMKAAGYVPLVEDGKLGPKTCGACKQFMPNAVPADCASKGYTAPVLASAASSSASSSVYTAPAPSVAEGMTTGAKIAIGAGVAIAVGLMAMLVMEKTGFTEGKA